jgi:hypothetical protein
MPKVPTFTASRQDWSHVIPNVQPYSPWRPAINAGYQLADTFMKLEEKARRNQDSLLLLSKYNDLQEKRIQELLDIRNNVKERATVDITKNEKDRVNDELDEFLSDVPDRVKNDATQVFYSLNAQYLGRVANHEYSETSEWKQTEAFRVVTNAEREAQDVSIGNFEGLFRVIGRMRGMLKSEFINDTTKAEVQGRRILLDTYATWARTDPDTAEVALTQNNSELQQVLGADFNKMLIALETGRSIAEQRRESDYRWAQRQQEEKFEGTTKAGVTAFLDPKQRLTIDWIVSNKDNMNSQQMRVLYSLLSAQDSAHPLDMSQVDYRDYNRLSKLVRHRVTMGFNYESVAEEIANAAEKTITGAMARSLLDKLNADKEMTPEQKRAYSIIENMKFHSNNENMNVAMREQAGYMLDLWIERHPDEDPIPFLQNTILKDAKDELTEWYLETWGSRQVSPEVRELEESEMPFQTETEKALIGNFFAKHPDIPMTSGNYSAVLNKLRSTYTHGGAH